MMPHPAARSPGSAGAAALTSPATVHDVLAEGDQVLLRLGEPPTPVPEPFAGLLQDYVRTGRPNRPGGTMPAGDWLFLGRQAEQPVDPATLEPGDLPPRASPPTGSVFWLCHLP
ncbi:hypothetical protein [Streptomyces sp. NPDC047009]|uniref:hypothetical protein n=1 Tax=Streptomyces sp. NPDC047009 TaxID=3154496 RepID=UPI00340B765F